MPNIEDDLPQALTPDPPIKRGRLLTARGGNVGDRVWVQVDGSHVSRQFTCATVVNSETVMVMGKSVFCATAPRTSLSRTTEYSRYRPIGVPVALSKIKYLYSIQNGSDLQFYVGGWQANPVLAKTLPVGTSISHASLDNHGGDDWSLNFTYGLTDSTTWIEYVASDPTKSLLYQTTYDGTPKCYRNGFWQLGASPGTSSGDSNHTGFPAPEYPSCAGGTETSFTLSIQSSSLHYYYKGQLLTTTTSQTSTSTTSQTSAYRTAPSGSNICTPGNSSGSTSIVSTLGGTFVVIPNLLNSSYSSSVETTSNNAAVAIYDNPNNPDAYRYDTTVTDHTIYSADNASLSLLQLSETGQEAIGNSSSAYSASSIPASNRFTYINSLHNGLTNPLPHGALDVYLSGITAIQTLDTNALKTQDLQTNVLFYDENLAASGSDQTVVFKLPSVDNTFAFYNASYNPN